MTKSSPSVVNGESAKRVIIGKIGAPHGVNGEMRIIPLTDFPERFDNLKQAVVGDEELSVVKIRHQGDVLLAKFFGCDNREQAARLTGRLITVSREDAAPLDEGEYYTFDIVGLSVINSLDESTIGEVESVLRTGSNDVYAVRSDDGREILLPALKSVVREINISDGYMRVIPPREYDDEI